MSNFLKPLTSIAPPQLIEFDRDALVNEIVERIQSDPNYNSIWDGELLQNFSYMMISSFAYLFSKNAEAANRLLRETFITTARDPDSITNAIYNFGINFKQNTAAAVTVTLSTPAGGGFTRPFNIPAGYILNAQNLDSTSSQFQIYKRDLNDPSKIDYRSSIEVSSGIIKRVEAFAGETQRVDFVLDAINKEKFIYKIDNENVIENSIRVYYSIGTSQERECIETDSFVVSPVNISTAFPGGTPHYKIKYYSDGRADIIFGTQNFGGSFPNEDSNITIFYRTGGGALSNISISSINQTQAFAVGSYTFDVLFRNLAPGAGGANREDINEAKFYAPYRVGRGRSLMDDRDVINELINIVNKHIVISPKYSPLDEERIPLLHYYNYIAPKRDFTQFLFSTPTASDTAETYKVKFESALNEFLNLEGIHDGEETNLLSTFRDNDFSFVLPKQPALNGTLYVSAYDENNSEIDRISWLNNYSGELNTPSARTSYAFISSQNGINGPISIVAGANDKIKFKIDDVDFGGIQYFDITLTPNVYGLTDGRPQSIAEEINTKIKAANPYYNSFSGSFVGIDSNNKIIIKSQITGQNSTIQIFEVSASAYLTLGNITPRFKTAIPENGRIFLSTSNFNNSNGQVLLTINTTRFSEQKTYSPSNESVNPLLWPDETEATGPVLTYTILDENEETFPLQAGTDLIIECYKGTTLQDTLTFSNISESDTNGAAADNGTCFDDGYASLNFNWQTNSITWRMASSDLAVEPYTYPAEYDETSTFIIRYQRKTYKFTSFTYEPNPYYQEGEANEILSKLKAVGKKTICVEPILKRVQFIPISVEITMKAKKGISTEELAANSQNLIYQYFSYDNDIAENTIGQGFNKNYLESVLNDKEINFGVDRAVVNSPSNIEDAVGNKYYFVLPEDFISRIITLEETYPQIQGLADVYIPVVNVT